MGHKQPSQETLQLMGLELEAFEKGGNSLDGLEINPDDYIDRSKIKVVKAKREDIFKLKVRDYDNATIAATLGLKEIEVEVIIERDQSKIKKDPRSKAILDLYLDGNTLEVIGTQYKLTRERIRQIIRREVGNQFNYGPMEQKYRQAEIETAVRAIVDNSRDDRVGETVGQKIAAAEEKGIQAQYFDSVLKYCTAVGINRDIFKKNFPELYSVVKRNENIRKSKWSQYYEACVECGTTTVKYRSTGFCEDCYPKSKHFKRMQQRSHLKNRDVRLAKNKIYLDDYNNRPDIIARKEKEYDDLYFGGNRKNAIKRDGYKCLDCGMNTEVKDKLGRQKVRVWHLNGNTNDHSLDNLGTYCQSCLYKHRLGRRWDNFGKGRSSKK